MDILSLFTAKQVYIGIPLVIAVWGLWLLLKADPAKGGSRGPGILMLGCGLLWVFAVLFVARMGGGTRYPEPLPEQRACMDEVVRYVGSPPPEKFMCVQNAPSSRLWLPDSQHWEEMPKGTLAITTECLARAVLPLKGYEVIKYQEIKDLKELKPGCGYLFGCAVEKRGARWHGTIRTLRHWTGMSSCLTNSPPPVSQ